MRQEIDRGGWLVNDWTFFGIQLDTIAVMGRANASLWFDLIAGN